MHSLLSPEDLPLKVRERLMLEQPERRAWVVRMHALLARGLERRAVRVWWYEPQLHLRGYSPLEVLPTRWDLDSPEVCLLEACAMMPLYRGSHGLG